MSEHKKSVFYNEQELLKSLIDIHILSKKIECDPMYFRGNFYKEIEAPKYKFDINPQVENVIKADAQDLPLEDNTLNSIILDPPFLFEKRKRKQNYYSALTHTIFNEGFEQLEDVYKGILREAHRILNKKGILIFKCQDYTDSKTTLTHCYVYNWATELGFYAKDIAILVLPNKVYNGNTTQRHLRKIHTYFFVFQKKQQ